MNALPHLLGYEIVEQIYEGKRTLLYRGVRQSDSLPIVIKLLKNPFPSFKELAQFLNQYTIAKDIDSPYVIKMMAIEPYKNVYAIVMEDFSGISLREILRRVGRFGNNPHTLTTFIKIAIQITEALDDL
jgi:serine/threonine protein kinase